MKNCIFWLVFKINIKPMIAKNYVNVVFLRSGTEVVASATGFVDKMQKKLLRP